MLYRLLLLTNAKFASRQFHSLLQLQPANDLLNWQHSSDQEIAYFVDAGLILKPRSLKDCCRMTIRDAVISHCCGAGILRSLLHLHLPRSLHNYLCYASEMPSSFGDGSSCSSENNDE
jgi:SOCS box